MIYTTAMTKRLVDIDDEALASARAALGTSTLKATVHAALVETAAIALRRRFVARMVDDGLPDLRDPHVAESTWR